VWEGTADMANKNSNGKPRGSFLPFLEIETERELPFWLQIREDKKRKFETEVHLIW
jgi:hypothetical protein